MPHDYLQYIIVTMENDIPVYLLYIAAHDCYTNPYYSKIFWAFSSFFGRGGEWGAFLFKPMERTKYLTSPSILRVIQVLKKHIHDRNNCNNHRSMI